MHTDYVNFTNDDANADYAEPITAEFHDIVDEVVEDTTTDQTENTSKMGKVICCKLYLRSEPSTESKEVTILNKDEELMIVSEDDPDWYGVYTAAGLEGFCMKEFIEVG